jgi:hypothetical protein
MTITEPTTMLTDYLLTALCVGLAWRLARASPGASLRLWRGAFSVTAFAALAGGTAHGFRVPLGELWDAVWSLTVWAIGLGSLLLVAASVRSLLRREARDAASRRAGVRWLKRALAVSLLALAVLVARVSPHQHFNQNDLYHVIQMVGLYFLYRGARLLHGLDGSESAT